MGEAAFYWIGVGVVGCLCAGAAIVALFWLYARFLHGRFGTIFFRRTERRISIASWYSSRLMSDEHYCADDWPIAQRPFYLSYELPSQRRLFVLVGILSPRRDMPIRGQHPDQADA